MATRTGAVVFFLTRQESRVEPPSDRDPIPGGSDPKRFRFQQFRSSQGSSPRSTRVRKPKFNHGRSQAQPNRQGKARHELTVRTGERFLRSIPMRVDPSGSAPSSLRPLHRRSLRSAVQRLSFPLSTSLPSVFAGETRVSGVSPPERQRSRPTRPGPTVFHWLSSQPLPPRVLNPSTPGSPRVFLNPFPPGNPIKLRNKRERDAVSPIDTRGRGRVKRPRDSPTETRRIQDTPVIDLGGSLT